MFPLPSQPTLPLLREKTYADFLRRRALEPGIRLFLSRAALNPDWPFPDTKFNPNTGRNLLPESYAVIYPWFLGRGTEALALHLAALDSLALTDAEKQTARTVFPKWIAAMEETILALIARYDGRCPFRVTRALELADCPLPNPLMTGPGDLFCAKGLLVSADAQTRQVGVEMLERIAKRVEQGLFGSEQNDDASEGLSQTMRMLYLAVPRLLAGKSFYGDCKKSLYAHACRFLQFVMERHFDRETERFSENIRPETRERGALLDPGHCAEFVGLGFSAIFSMENDPDFCPSDASALFAEAQKILPRILLSAMRMGFHEPLGGMFKAVNNRTGEVLDDTMPWWNLPETMRAGYFAALTTPDARDKADCLAVVAKCHNAYFGRYLNPALQDFPYQTRSGKTGEVLDAAPAIPEGDPLYHSNLCFLEMLRRGTKA